MRWRPGDRFRVAGEEFVLVDAADPLPGEAFVRDYVDVRLWGARRVDTGGRFLVTGELLGDALAVERVSAD